MTTAVGHPNIALVKYWGKQPGAGNVPATPSLSITLDALSTYTRVALRAGDGDEVRLNGRLVADAKALGFLARMRAAFDLPPIVVHTRNDFPTGAGLASSASGFAALVAAVDGAFGLGLSPAVRSVWARKGSASAARSIFGGFATLEAGDGEWSAASLLDKNSWPLEVAIALTSQDAKPVPSTIGMERSRNTSPFYRGWIESAPADFDIVRRAVLARDFETLAEVAEHSCLKLHALMLSTRPGLLYWNQATLACIEVIRKLRTAGVPAFFTVDAGPQVKAVCAPGRVEEVAAALATVPGVLRVVKSRLGDGTCLVGDADG